MSASKTEVQEVADRLLELLGVRIVAGSIEIHFADSLAQKVDVNTTPWRRRSDDRGPLVRSRP